MGLVWLEARRAAYRRRALGFQASAEEFLGDAYLGLVKACEDFDPGRGYKLSTMATPRIRGAILDALRTETKSKLKHPPRFADLSPSLVDAQPLPLEQAESESTRHFVRDLVERRTLLSPKERFAVERRYWHGEELSQIAHRLKCSRGRVSQLLKSAHEKILGALLPT
ncbi:MAG: sigma-70 family RNA polymerase sigma factor, partial [Solirubrobacteraceae bacterium]